MNDHDTQVIQALSLSADEIVKNDVHFTDQEAHIISVHKVATDGRKAIENFLENFAIEEDEKHFWEFWK